MHRCAPIGGGGQRPAGRLPRKEVAGALRGGHKAAAAPPGRLSLVLRPKEVRQQAGCVSSGSRIRLNVHSKPQSKLGNCSHHQCPSCLMPHLLLQRHARQRPVLRHQALPVARLHRHHQRAIRPLAVAPAVRQSGRQPGCLHSQQHTGGRPSCGASGSEIAAAASQPSCPKTRLPACLLKDMPLMQSSSSVVEVGTIWPPGHMQKLYTPRTELPAALGCPSAVSPAASASRGWYQSSVK